MLKIKPYNNSQKTASPLNINSVPICQQYLKPYDRIKPYFLLAKLIIPIRYNHFFQNEIYGIVILTANIIQRWIRKKNGGFI